MTEKPTTKNRATLAIESVLLLVPAVVFAATGDAPQTLVLVALGLTASFALSRALPTNTRAVVYAGVAVLLATVLSEEILPVDPDRFFLVPAHIACPAVLFIGVAATYFDQRPTRLVSLVALALIATMLAGNTVAPAIESPRLPFVAPLLRRLHAWYAAAVALEILAMLWLLPRLDHRLHVAPRGARRTSLRTVVVVVALTATACSVAGLRQAAFFYERLLQRTFNNLFMRVMERRSGRIVFGSDVDLWRTVPHRQRRDAAIVLRAVAESAPGYLRGRVYSQYADGRWVAGKAGSEFMRRTAPGGGYAFGVFARHAAAPAPGSIGDAPAAMVETHVFPSAAFHSDVLLASGAARHFELIADALSNTRDGVLQPEGWERGGGYSFRAHSAAADTAYPYPGEDSGHMTEYLGLPAALDALLVTVAGEMPGASGASNTSQRISRLLEFFATRFSYALDLDRRPDLDPVAEFLGVRRRGHCELFASAAVLLLRAQGVPARYVTGFVCSEAHPRGRFWVARLRDAHAWAEAYVAEERAWVIVEATPASGRPAPSSGYGTIGAGADMLRMAWLRLFALVKRGYVAEAVIAAIVELAGFLRWFLGHPGRATVAAAFAVIAVHGLWRRRRARRLARDVFLAPVRRDLRRILERIDHCARRRGVHRALGGTVREQAQALAAMPKSAQAEVLVELLHEYEALRYRSTPPSAETVTRFREKVRRQLRRLS